MTDASSLLESIEGISSRVSDDMSEQDVENAFLNEDFFQILGYEGAGIDLRSEFTLPDDRSPDYVTLNDNESVVTVYSSSVSELPPRTVELDTETTFPR